MSHNCSVRSQSHYTSLS